MTEPGTTKGHRRRGVGVAVAALAICATLATAALAASTDFVEPATSPEPAGDLPIAIAAGDFDADSDLDLATANFFGGNVTILRNRGTGDFLEPISSPESLGSSVPRAIEAADFDGDGDDDLAVGNVADPGDVRILRSSGNGNFVEPATSPEPTAGAFSLAAADLDGDGDVDLATADPQTGLITILRNNGSGGFVEVGASPEDGGDTPTTIEAADLDGDGDPDLVVGSQSHPDLTILRNNGSAGFAELSSSPETVGDVTDDLFAADLDGDGDGDVAVAGGADLINVLKNNGSGNFTEPSSSPEPIGDPPRAITAADFDLDGDRDLAVANPGTPDATTILRNNGSGGFAEVNTSPEALAGVNAVVSRDFDGDGDPDLAGSHQSNQVTILLND